MAHIRHQRFVVPPASHLLRSFAQSILEICEIKVQLSSRFADLVDESREAKKALTKCHLAVVIAHRALPIELSEPLYELLRMPLRSFGMLCSTAAGSPYGSVQQPNYPGKASGRMPSRLALIERCFGVSGKRTGCPGPNHSWTMF
jgi:hypothetical protein